MFRFKLLCQRCPSGRAQLPNLRCITAGSEFVRLWDSHEASSLTMTRSCSHCLPPRKTPKEKDPTKENLHQLTNSEPKRSTDGLQKPGKRFGESARHCFGSWKLCGFFDDRINRCGVCQELCVLQQVWIPGRIVGGLPTESPWKTSRNTSKLLREKQMNHRQAQHLLRANTS